MKDLAGNELEVRWAKCEDLVPGTWCLDFFSNDRATDESGLGYRVLEKDMQAVATPGDMEDMEYCGEFSLSGRSYPIDDRYGPVLLGDKK